MKNRHMNRHHLCPSSRKNEGFNTSIKKNIKDLQQVFHENWHKVFYNLHPQEQLQLWYNVNKEIIKRETRQKIEEVLGGQKEDFYIPELVVENLKAFQKARIQEALGQPSLFE